MEMTGERRIPAPRQRVWDALNDPEVLRASIPGCESVERVGDDQFQARVALKIGPMSAKFGGKVRIENPQPPESYTIVGEGQGGAMGFAKGGADVSLEEETADATLLRYAVKAQVGGKMAQLGARLVDSTAKHMADQFFDRFAAQVAPPPAEEAQPQAAAPVEGASTEAGPDAQMRSAPRPTPPMDPTDQDAVRNTDTEYLGRREAGEGTGPLTQHDAEGPTPGGGRPVHRPNISPEAATPGALRPLRTLTANPLGLPLQFWLGSAAMVVILLLLFVVG